MARVHGRVQTKDTHSPLVGDILFEPMQLGYVVDNILYANFVYRQELNKDGCFDIEVMPGDYNVYLDDAKMQVRVPAVSDVTLKEMLKTKYRP